VYHRLVCHHPNPHQPLHLHHLHHRRSQLLIHLIAQQHNLHRNLHHSRHLNQRCNRVQIIRRK
jgi:hypothetical protein